MPFRCVECKEQEERPHDEEDRKFLAHVHKDMMPDLQNWEERKICLSCAFWIEIVEQQQAKKKTFAIVEGTVFSILPDVDPKDVRKMGGLGVGYGGSAFLFRFKDGREILSHNVWHRGEVPPRFKERLKDNAESLDHLEIHRYKEKHGLFKPGQKEALEELHPEYKISQEPREVNGVKIDRKKFPIENETEFVSEIQVMHSAAGYYLGRSCIAKDEPDMPFEQPYSRESGYYRSEEAAKEALKEGFILRKASENEWAYNNGKIPKPPRDLATEKDKAKDLARQRR